MPKTQHAVLPEDQIGREAGPGDGSYARGRSIERLRVLWMQRRFLSRVLGGGVALGIMVAFLLPRQYESSVQLMSPDAQSSAGALIAAMAGNAGNGLGAIAGDLLGGKSTGDQFVGILRSRTVQERLVRRFDLNKVYRDKLDEDAQKTLAANTGIGIDRKTGIISIVVTDREPVRAQAIAQAYVEELDRLVAELSTSAAHRERIFLEDRLKAVKRDLDQAARDFSEFSSKNTAIDISEQGKAMVQSAALVQGQLVAAASELKGLEQIYSPNNVRVRSVAARIAELQQQLRKMGGTSSATDSTGVGDGYPSIRQLPILGVEYYDLYRRTKIQESVYEALTSEYEMAKVQEAKETPSVKILDPANVPQRKSFPPRLVIIVLVTCAMFAGGVLLVLLRSEWDRIPPHSAEKNLLQEVVHTCAARLPWAPPNGSRLQALTHRAWIRFVRRNETESGETRE